MSMEHVAALLILTIALPVIGWKLKLLLDIIRLESVARENSSTAIRR